jgi:hypothetical protein
MNTMQMPGYTAEASLRNVSTRHRATTPASVSSGLVRPAGPLSDTIDLETPFPSLGTSFPSFGPVFTPRPPPCLKWQCIQVPNRNPICFRTLGFWNSVTRRCE